MIGVEQWAGIRRMRFAEQRSIREIHRLTGYHRKTIRRAIESERPPGYRRPPGPSKLDPFKGEIHDQLNDDPEVPSMRLRELCEELGYAGGRDQGFLSTSDHRNPQVGSA